MCSQYVGWWILPNGWISSEYWLKRMCSATTILKKFVNFRNALSVFKLISKPLTNHWQWVTNPTTVHGKHGANIQAVDISIYIWVGFFWWLFPKFLEGGCKSLTQTRNVFDSTTYLNDVWNDIFDSTCVSQSELGDPERQIGRQ